MAVNQEVIAYGGTEQFPFRNVGTIDAVAGNADVALGVAERDFATANALANSVSIVVETSWSSVEVRAIFATNDEDAIFDIWGLRKDGTYMTRLCTVTAKAGQQVAGSGLVFADTLTVTNMTWPGSVTKLEPGTDHMARLIVDMWGWSKILFHGNDTVDEDVVIEIAGVS